MKKFPLILSIAATCATATSSFGHDGRRFQVQVVNNQLRAQGVNTISNFVPGGAPFNTTGAPVLIDPLGPRPYFNAMHGHWEDEGGTQIPQSDLPGYDLSTGTEALQTYDVFWNLTGASKWENVSASLVADPSSGLSLPAFVADGTTPNFVPLAADETISARFIDPVFSTSTIVSTDAPGTIELVTDFDGVVSVDADGIANNSGSNGYDRDFTYFYGNTTGTAPADTLYLLEAYLSTNAPGIADSETIYTIFSPDGVGPLERLHFASLFAEEQLGTPVPEPTSVGLVLVGCAGLARRRSTQR